MPRQLVLTDPSEETSNGNETPPIQQIYTLFCCFCFVCIFALREWISSKHRVCDSIHVFTSSSYFPTFINKVVTSRYDIILLHLDSTKQISNDSRDALLLILVVVLSTQTQVGYAHTTEHYAVSLDFRLSFMYFIYYFDHTFVIGFKSCLQ